MEKEHFWSGVITVWHRCKHCGAAAYALQAPPHCCETRARCDWCHISSFDQSLVEVQALSGGVPALATPLALLEGTGMRRAAVGAAIAASPALLGTPDAPLVVQFLVSVGLRSESVCQVRVHVQGVECYHGGAFEVARSVALCPPLNP